MVVPAFTYVATAEAVVRAGATPVFADVDLETYNLDAESAEAAIRTAKGLGLAARCIMPVDLFGQPADYAAIRRLADAHGLNVLADAAQSFGATWRGRRRGDAGGRHDDELLSGETAGLLRRRRRYLHK